MRKILSLLLILALFLPCALAETPQGIDLSLIHISEPTRPY